jgi:hypothetical protein
MRIGKLWLTVSIAIIATQSAHAETDNLAARQAAAHAFLAARYADKQVETISVTLAQYYAAQMHKTHPEISQIRLDALQKAIESNLMATKNNFIDREADLYAAKLSLQDLQAATTFYKTPTGKKLADPALVPEIAKYQVDWSRAAVTKATTDLNATSKAHQ